MWVRLGSIAGKALNKREKSSMSESGRKMYYYGECRLQAVVGEEGLAGDAADVSWMNSWFVLYNNSMASMYACRHAKIQPMAPTMQFARDVDISYNTHCRVTATGEVPTSHAQASM
ncbi:conserved hypothetical protein [Coccidioides posadasii str. Silveira]|uniref:Uncharacterized protein n=1 Tax=Coccidioides posadasii (strain RMSCC 757 / Silveira) TaxID=443226 RepID=E9D8E5_COCPS|nr:conserved hypothetical protein [Coccidioides posadasii str. Silveira]